MLLTCRVGTAETRECRELYDESRVPWTSFREGSSWLVCCVYTPSPAPQAGLRSGPLVRDGSSHFLKDKDT